MSSPDLLNVAKSKMAECLEQNRPKQTGLICWVIKPDGPIPYFKDEQDQRAFRALHFAELLCEAGNQVIFISSNFIHREKRFRNHPCDKQIQTKKENLKIYLLKGFGYRKNISVSRLLHDIKLASNFVTSVKNLSKPDVIICSFPSIFTSWRAVDFAIQHKIPFILDIRDMWPKVLELHFRNHRILKYLPFLWIIGLVPIAIIIKRTFSKATNLISVGNGLLMWAQEFADRPTEKKKLDRVIFQNQTDKYGQAKRFRPRQLDQSEIIRLIWAGDIGSFADYQVIISALPKLEERFGGRIQLLHCGRILLPRKIGASILKAPNYVGLGWLGNETLHQELEKAHVALFCYRNRPDFQGSLPNKIVDYCMHGLPIISSVRGELENLHDARSFVFNYEEGDVCSFIEAISECISDPSRFSSSSWHSRKFFEKRLSSDITKKALIDLLQQTQLDRQKSIR